MSKILTSTVPDPAFWRSRHEAQRNVFRAFDGGCRRFWLRWHRRARKTTVWVNLMIREAIRYERRTYLYIAPTYKQGKSIIWQDPNMLFKWLPDEKCGLWQKNEQELRIFFPATKSSIKIIGGDNPDSARGIDCHGVVYDEWALCKPELWTEIIRPIIAQDSDRWAAFIFTPKGRNHAYQQDTAAAMDQWPRGQWHYGVLKAEDSGLIPPAELEKARDDMPPGLYEQEFNCSFEAANAAQVIHFAWIEASRTKTFHVERQRKFLTCDPARFGDDETVIYVWRDTLVVAEKIYGKRDTMYTASQLHILAKENGCTHIAVDCGGGDVGTGVVDRLNELSNGDYEVMPIGSAEAATDNRKYFNRRAEIWSTAGKMLETGEVERRHRDEALDNQLCTPNYDFKSGRLLIEPKTDVKDRLGRSPDRADAYVMGLWLYSTGRVPPAAEVDDVYDDAGVGYDGYGSDGGTPY